MTGGGYLKDILNHLPFIILVADKDLTILDANETARRLLGEKRPVILRRLCGDVLRCAHAQQSEGGCGTTAYCPECAVRDATLAAVEGRTTIQQMAEMLILEDDSIRDRHFLVTTTPIESEGENLAIVVLEDVSELMELRGLIPICSSCRKVRDDKDYWSDVEDYLRRHSHLRFTHGICPDCLARLYPDEDLSRPDSPA